MVLKMLLPLFAAGFLLYCGLLEFIFVKIGALKFSDVNGVI